MSETPLSEPAKLARWLRDLGNRIDSLPHRWPVAAQEVERTAIVAELCQANACAREVLGMEPCDENARLRTALQVIATDARAACAQLCTEPYRSRGRHASDCPHEFAEEAEAALAGD